MASRPARKAILPHPRPQPGARGTALIEFVLATGLLIVPIFLGLISVGLSLVLANQVTEVCRDVGHMFAYGVDFSQAASQALVANQLARGLNIVPSTGTGVIYLSKLTYVDGTSCSSAGLQPNSGNCPNINQTIVIRRLIIGNPGIKPTTFAPAINSAIIDSTGVISSSDYLTDPSVRAPAFQSIITLTVNQYAYVTETFVRPPAAGLWSLFGANVVMARSIF